MDNTDVTFIFQILIIYQEVEDELPKKPTVTPYFTWKA